jgi:tetratricopeptide (TPR) repeat protein
MRRALSLALLAASTAQADPVLARIDALLAQRDEIAAATALEAELLAALKSRGEDFEVLWRAARFASWVAEGAIDERLMEQKGKEAWDLAERAIKAKPERVEGYLFAALGAACYANAIGPLKAVTNGVAGTFSDRLDQAIALDAGFGWSAALLASGKFHVEMPWPLRDRAQAIALYQKALKQNPDNVRGWFWLAEAQHGSDDDKAARESVAKALALPGDYDPPEARRVKAWAKVLAAQLAN